MKPVVTWDLGQVGSPPVTAAPIPLRRPPIHVRAPLYRLPTSPRLRALTLDANTVPTDTVKPRSSR
jgi:hypothetical protein